MSNYSDRILADGPVGYWRLNETSGTNFDDATANNRDGTGSGTMALNQTSALNATTGGGASIDFTAANTAHITIADANDFSWSQATGLTVEAWLRADAQDADRWAITKMNSSGNYEWGIRRDNARDGWSAVIFDGAGSNVYTVCGGTAVGAGFYHVVVVFKANADAEIEIYVNGVIDTPYDEDTNDAGTPASSGTSGVRIGARTDTNSGNWDGRVQDVAIYRKVLTATEIADHYAIGTGAAIVYATVTDIDIDGIDASVAVDDGATAEVTNIAVDGIDATVTTTQNPTITAEVTDIEIDGKDPTSVGPEINILAEVTNVSIAGSAGNSHSIPASVTAVVTDIDIAGINPISPYIASVLTDAPVRYFRMDDASGSLTDFMGGGSIALTNTVAPTYAANGIPGNGILDAVTFNAGSKGAIASVTNFFNTTGSATIEFWYKYTGTPSNANGIIMGNSTNNVSDSGGGYSGVIRGPAIKQGKLGSYVGPGLGQFSTTNITVADGSWHHIVITRAVSGSTQTFVTYIDGSAFNGGSQILPLPFDNAYNWNALFWRGGSSFGSVTNYDNKINGTIDELAFYNQALVGGQVTTHYLLGNPSSPAEVEAEVSNITVDDSESNVGIAITAEVSNININMQSPNIVTPGALSIGASKAGITITGHDAAAGAIAFVEQNTIVTNVGITGKSANVRTADLGFVFIDSGDTSITALDAQTIVGIDYGAFFYNQTKTAKFKLGNVAQIPFNFEISATSGTSGVTDAVSFSVDNITFTDSLTLEQIEPNVVTDIVYVKFDPTVLSTGSGTFLINVEQVNA